MNASDRYRAPATLKELRQRARGENNAYFYAIRDRLPADEVAREARLQVARRYSMAKQPTRAKPRVRVFHRAGKPWYVLRIGVYVVGAYGWERLVYNAAFGPWKRIERMAILKNRWVGYETSTVGSPLLPVRVSHV